MKLIIAIVNASHADPILKILTEIGYLTADIPFERKDGTPDPDYASKMLTPHYGAVVAKEPRSEESQAVCRLLGQRLAEWTSVFVHGRKDEHPAKKLSGRMRP